jgi:hypothetical protein
VLPLLAALNQVTKAQVAFRQTLQIICVLIGGREERQLRPSCEERRVWPQIRGGFGCFALLDRGPRGQDIVIVLQRHLDGFIKRNPHGSLSLGQRECRQNRND